MKNSKDIDSSIEELELADMTESEITRTIQAFSAEGVKLRAERKRIRYQLYRLRTESEGKCASEVDSELKSHFERQLGFDGWRSFASTWDVSISDPMSVVSRRISEQDEWDNIVKSKFPQIKADGKIVYPDLKVKEKVDAESRKRANK